MPQDSFKPEIPPFLSRYLIANPEEFASNLLRAYERGSLALAQLAERPDAKALIPLRASSRPQPKR